MPGLGSYHAQPLRDLRPELCSGLIFSAVRLKKTWQGEARRLQASLRRSKAVGQVSPQGSVLSSCSWCLSMLRGWIRVTSLIHRILWGHSWLEIGSIFSWKPLETQKYMCPFQAVNMFLKHLVLYLDLMILLLGIQKKYCSGTWWWCPHPALPCWVCGSSWWRQLLVREKVERKRSVGCVHPSGPSSQWPGWRSKWSTLQAQLWVELSLSSSK